MALVHDMNLARSNICSHLKARRINVQLLVDRFFQDFGKFCYFIISIGQYNSALFQVFVCAVVVIFFNLFIYMRLFIFALEKQYNTLGS